MSGVAVAVHAHRGGVLLAAADREGVWLLTAAPSGTPPATVVAAYFGDDPPDVLVRVGTTPAGPFPGAPRVLAVPVAVGVLSVGPAPPSGPVLVVDGPDTALVDDGRVTPLEPDRDGWDHPAAVTDLARWGGAVGIVLAGERSADDPGWVAAIGRDAPCPVRLAGPSGERDPAAAPGAGPASAAVLGAAMLGSALLAQEEDARTAAECPDATAPSRPRMPGARQPGGPASWPGEPEPGGPEQAGRYRRPGWVRRGLATAAVPAASLLGSALILAGTLVGGGRPDPVPVTPGLVVQYGYALPVPDDWEHTGGDPARRRVLLTPAGRPDGADLVVVERHLLPYDAAREPARAHRELTALLGGHDDVTPPRPQVAAGRAVLGYTQRPGDGTVVDWFVLVEAGDQLVVGCRRPEAAEPAPACAEVLGSVHRTP